MQKLQVLSQILKFTNANTILFPQTKQNYVLESTDVKGLLLRIDSSLIEDAEVEENVIYIGSNNSFSSDYEGMSDEYFDAFMDEMRELGHNYKCFNTDEYCELPKAAAIDITHNMLDLQLSTERTINLARTINNALNEGGVVNIWDHDLSIAKLLPYLTNFEVTLLQADDEWIEGTDPEESEGCLHIMLRKINNKLM